MPSENAAASDLNARPSSPSRLTSLASSLGLHSWPHGDAALEEALRVKSEQERTKQEYYRLESRQKVLDILNLALQLGIPGPAVPLLFAGNEDLGAANASRLASASQASNAAAAAHHAALQAAALSPSNVGGGSGAGATAVSSHGPFRFGQPGVPTYHLQPPFQPPVQQPMHPPSMQQQPLQQVMQGHPSHVQSPVTPARTRSMDRPGPTSGGRLNGRGGSPMQQQLQPAFTQGQPNSNSRFDVLSFERPQESLDRSRLGHRATASAVPAFTNDSSHLMPPRSVASNQGSPAQAHMPQGPMTSTPFYPSQLTAPPQMVSSSPSITPRAQPSQLSPPFAPQAGSPQQGIAPQRQAPGVSVTPSRPPPVRGRGHGASFSTSDLQIHQWKPKQMTRDNRWKVVTSPSGPGAKDKPEDPTGAPPAKIQAQRDPDTVVRGVSEPQAPRSPPPRPPSASSSTSVIAAQNTKRRGMGHTRSRSSVSILPSQSPSHPASPPSVSRHEEGVAVLANLASEQNKIGYENIKTESHELPKQDESDLEKHRRLPSLLSYLESQAKHLPPTMQRSFPGATSQSQSAQQDQVVPPPASSPRGPQK